jgi:phosphoenolpyruvate-protein phosphotransferase (PTS system enzyme I)
MTEETTPEPLPEIDQRRDVGLELRGTPVAHGLALGVVRRKDYDLDRARAARVPLDQVEPELNCFHSSLTESKRQLESLKTKLSGKVPPDHLRILDTHIAYLKDSVFLSDVENLILNEQMSLEAAIVKVISDFDRIFRLVENQLLRERAVDLRDVGIRVLRNMETKPRDEEAPELSRDYILVARELSIVDMFNLAGEGVLGIVTEEGGLTSHAAILARSMGVPTLTGVEGLQRLVHTGDFLILDATEGVVRVNPDDVVRAQFREARAAAQEGESIPTWSDDDFQTSDGTPISVQASCGNLPEVEQAIASGLGGIGLYRTELLYLLAKEQPSLDSLIAHYASVLEEAGGRPVTFRLLDIDSSFEVQYLHEGREANPALGSKGIRVLLEREPILRRQLKALLRVAVEGTHVRLAVPFLVDVSELRRVKEVLFEARLDLRRTQSPQFGELEVGAVIETPAAALGVRELLPEADFLLLSFDSLAQYLLAADRENQAHADRFTPIHPVLLRTVRDVVEAAAEASKPVHVVDSGAILPGVLPFLIGAGVRSLCVPPIVLSELARSLSSFDVEQAAISAESLAGAACQADVLPIVDSFLRSYDSAGSGD